MLPTSRGTQGFTLIEVLVAMAVFGIGTLGFLALQTTTLTSRIHAQLMTTATQLTITQLNDLMLNNPAALTSGSKVVTSNGAQYSQSWTVEDNSPVGGLDTLRVTTSWNQKERNDSVEFSVVLPQNGS